MFFLGNPRSYHLGLIGYEYGGPDLFRSVDLFSILPDTSIGFNYTTPQFPTYNNTVVFKLETRVINLVPFCGSSLS